MYAALKFRSGLEIVMRADVTNRANARQISINCPALNRTGKMLHSLFKPLSQR